MRETNLPNFQKLLYTNHDYLVLVEELIFRSMELNRESRNRPIQVLITDV